MNLDAVVFGEVTVGQCLYIVAGIVVAVVVLKAIKKLFFPAKSNLQHSVAYTCSSCGWKGHIGQYARQCPKCSHPVL